MLAVKELSEVSGKALLPGFGDDEEDNEDTISRTVQEITALFRECERRLKEIHNARDEGTGDEVCPAEPAASWGGRAGGWTEGGMRWGWGGWGGSGVGWGWVGRRGGAPPLAHRGDPPS